MKEEIVLKGRAAMFADGVVLLVMLFAVVNVCVTEPAIVMRRVLDPVIPEIVPDVERGVTGTEMRHIMLSPTDSMVLRWLKKFVCDERCNWIQVQSKYNFQVPVV